MKKIFTHSGFQILLALAISGYFYISSIPLKNTQLIQQGETQSVNLPFLHSQVFDHSDFEVKTDFFYVPFNATFNIIPDDCVQEIRVGNRVVDLSKYETKDLCDLGRGVTVNLGKYASWGYNTLSIKLKNEKGLWGINIKRPTMGSGWWVFVFCVAFAAWRAMGWFVPRLSHYFNRMKWLPYAVVVVLSYFTYFQSYWEPNGFYWDENYHVAAAEKYLSHTFFMETHPPLGKLFIAAGQAIFFPNQVRREFASLPKIAEGPADISFVGYRFFPALFAWMSCLLFYFLIRQIVRKPWIAFCLSGMFLFDNALIVHQRGAMLDSVFIFFSLLFLAAAFELARSEQKWPMVWLVCAALSFGCVCATKASGTIWILFLPWILWGAWRRDHSWKSLTAHLAVFFTTSIAIYCAIWQIHFGLTTQINASLPNNGYYSASNQYHSLLKEGRGGTLSTFPVALKAALRHFESDQYGIAKLNMCNREENGSPVFFWPFGGRTINYRWTRVEPALYKYLYLVPNPWIWALGVMGLLLFLGRMYSIAFVRKTSLKKIEYNRLVISGFLFFAWAGYMYVMSWGSAIRVLYLYSYFLALLLSFFLFANEFMQTRLVFGKKITSRFRNQMASWILVFTIACYAVYSPLTYFHPIRDTDFAKLKLLDFWSLHCVDCPDENGIAKAK